LYISSARAKTDKYIQVSIGPLATVLCLYFQQYLVGYLDEHCRLCRFNFFGICWHIIYCFFSTADN